MSPVAAAAPGLTRDLEKSMRDALKIETQDQARGCGAGGEAT